MNERTAVQEREAAPATQVWMLALIGGLAGFCVWWILDQPALLDRRPGAAAIAWCCTFATAFAFTCGQPRISWSVLFSTSTATAVGLIAYWNLAPGPDLWRDDPTWRLLSTALSLIVAVPLFQTVRDAGRWSLPYPELHRYAWTDVVIGAGALLFWLVSAALIVLWGELFKLIGVNAFADTFAKGWFMAPAFGAIAASGVSLLREWSRIVGTLQRVVMAVLAVLAPVLGFVLLLFLMFLPFTGLAPLWGATKSTTPIILGVVLLALLLVNSVLADRAEEEATSKLLRLGAIVLGMTILPLAVIAATSTWLRVAQYGLTPDRCWAIVFVTFALAYGVGYLASFAHGVSAWPAAVRRGNVLLALSIGGVALLLATPLLDFAALSTRNQVARLLTAQVSVEAFDFAALKFDFGEPGKRALTTLRNISGRPDAAAIRAEVARVGGFKYRQERATRRQADQRRELTLAAIDRGEIYPRGATLPPALRAALASSSEDWSADCARNQNRRCAVLLVTLTNDARPQAVVFTTWCNNLASNVASNVASTDRNCGGFSETWHETVDGWKPGASDEPHAKIDDRLLNALAEGKFETRLEDRRVLYVEGVRVNIDP